MAEPRDLLSDDLLATDHHPADIQATDIQALGDGLPPALRSRAAELIGRLREHHAASAAHSLRVAQITMAMWRAAPELLGCVDTALLGSLLHDVGKLAVPREILTTRRILEPEERGVMSAHSAMGAEMLLDQGFSEEIAAVARGHHERWSGGGYPTGLAARLQAPIVRAVAVADAFDAMTDPHRAYRSPLNRADALREVAACAGTHFEPAAAQILARCLPAERWSPDLPPAFRPAARFAGELSAAH